ncbi:hypothetical protein KIPB_013053, partial [Kipferlia bialata]
PLADTSADPGDRHEMLPVGSVRSSSGWLYHGVSHAPSNHKRSFSTLGCITSTKNTMGRVSAQYRRSKGVDGDRERERVARGGGFTGSRMRTVSRFVGDGEGERERELHRRHTVIPIDGHPLAGSMGGGSGAVMSTAVSVADGDSTGANPLD